MSETPSTITDLQAQWHALNDLDRAKAILAIIHSDNISQRKLATLLNCSASLIRHLLLAAQARPEDRALARRGEISTRELKRRSTATTTRRTKMHHEALELERTKAALQGCKEILEWLVSEKIGRPYGEQVIGEARLQLAYAEQNDRLPRGTAPADMTRAEIIVRCRPAKPPTDEMNSMALYARWLALWVFYAMPDPRIRDQAIELALSNQAKG